jgi:hypothetical protein
MKTKKTRNKREKELVDVHEKFILYLTKPLDSKNRITLGGRLTRLIGRRMNVEAYQIFISRSGDILLRPSVSVPASEAWVYQNPEVVKKVRKGLEEAREGKTERVDDLNSFLDSL